MKCLKNLFVIALALSTSMLQSISTVNPQPGQSTWTVAGNIGDVLDEIGPYQPTELSNANQSGGTITISSSGIYRLSEELDYPVVINADKVDLDLNGYGISLSSAVSSITINSGKEKIVVRNGRVQNTITSSQSSIGIDIRSNSPDTISSVYVDNVRLFGCGYGISVVADSGATVTDCLLSNCSSSGSGFAGFIMTRADNVLLANCRATGPGSKGFHLQLSSHCILDECVASGVSPDVNSPAYGFHLEESTETVVFRCVASNVSSPPGYIACGFYLESSTYNFLDKCVSSKNNGPALGAGFRTTSSHYNTFNSCVAIHNMGGVTLGFSISSSNYNFLDECTGIENQFNFSIAGTGNDTFRCRSKSGGTFSWFDAAANTNWTARG